MCVISFPNTWGFSRDPTLGGSWGRRSAVDRAWTSCNLDPEESYRRDSVVGTWKAWVLTAWPSSLYAPVGPRGWTALVRSASLKMFCLLLSDADKMMIKCLTGW